MTSSITYNLPDDTAQHRIAVNADFIIMQLGDIRRILRCWSKDETAFDTPQEAIQEVNSRMQDLFQFLEE